MLVRRLPAVGHALISNGAQASEEENWAACWRCALANRYTHHQARPPRIADAAVWTRRAPRR